MLGFHQMLGIRFLTKSHLIANILRAIEKPPTHQHLRVEDPSMAIIKAMNNYIKGKGGKFIIGTTDSYQDLENFSIQQNILYIDLTTNYKYPDHGKHWNPQGHDFVAEKIFNFIKKNNL
jgi:hypothetical protein